VTNKLKGTISKYLNKFKEEGDVLKNIYHNCGRSKALNDIDKNALVEMLEVNNKLNLKSLKSELELKT